MHALILEEVGSSMSSTENNIFWNTFVVSEILVGWHRTVYLVTAGRYCWILQCSCNIVFCYNCILVTFMQLILCMLIIKKHFMKKSSVSRVLVYDSVIHTFSSFFFITLYLLIDVSATILVFFKLCIYLCQERNFFWKLCKTACLLDS